MSDEEDWTDEKAQFMAHGGDEDAEPHPTARARDESRLGPLAREFTRLGQHLLAAPTVADVLKRVVAAAHATLPGAEMVSVTLRSGDGRFTTPVRTGAVAVHLDELQYALDEGPCVEATRTPGEGLVYQSELHPGRLWPRWGPAAAEHGVHSVLAVGLFPFSDPPRLGALNMFAFQPDGLAQLDRELAVLLAAHASTALAATQAVTSAELETAQLREALNTRDVIGQAKGILMQRRGCGAEEAFDILRRTSQQLNVKLVELADTLVAHRRDL